MSFSWSFSLVKLLQTSICFACSCQTTFECHFNCTQSFSVCVCVGSFNKNKRERRHNRQTNKSPIKHQGIPPKQQNWKITSPPKTIALNKTKFRKVVGSLIKLSRIKAKLKCFRARNKIQNVNDHVLWSTQRGIGVGTVRLTSWRILVSQMISE